MKKINILALICVCINLFSCYSTKQILEKTTYETIPFKTSDKKLSYCNDIDSTRTTVWQLLRETQIISSTIPDGDVVKISFDEPGYVKARLYFNEEQVDSLEIKGKIKDSIFSANRKMICVPIVVINYIDERKLLIGLDQNDHLILKKGTYYYVGFLFKSIVIAKGIEEFMIEPIQ
jgi:hypothetical protein